jgi:hypothetical protein
MIKIVIFAVLGLLVGLGGGSAFSVLKAKKAFAAQGAQQAKVVADSLAKAEEEGSKHAAPAATKDSTHAPIDSTPPAELHSSPSGTKPSVTGGGVTPSPKAKTVTPPPRSSAPVSTKDSVIAKHAVGTAAPAKVAPAPWNRAVATIQPRVTVPPTASGKASGPLPPKTAPAPITPDKIGKIFAAMPARDAAKVLEQLDDSDVQSILGSLSGKQAAAILQSFPPIRAAAISKAALRGGVTKP